MRFNRWFCLSAWLYVLMVAMIAAAWGCSDDEGSRAEPQTPASSPVTFFSGPLPRVMAHRGGGGLFPENTLYAFEQALAMGVQIVETDVRATKDGIVVHLHDEDVSRTTDGQGPVNGMALEEVKALDAAYWFSTDGGETYPLRGTGVKIPTLAETFERFPEAPFAIEIKQWDPPIEEQVVSLIEQFNMMEKVCLASFNDEVISRVRLLNPDICTSEGTMGIIGFLLLPLEILLTLEIDSEALQVPPEELGIPVVTDTLVEKAKALDIEVHVWTVNDPEEMIRFLDMGVHGIITDYPDRLLEVVGHYLEEGFQMR